MKLKAGKKYETADGMVLKVRHYIHDPDFFDWNDSASDMWHKNGSAVFGEDLVRRHYKKPVPLHKLKCKVGDKVTLVAWEGRTAIYNTDMVIVNDINKNHKEICAKGQRPLFIIRERV